MLMIPFKSHQLPHQCVGYYLCTIILQLIMIFVSTHPNRSVCFVKARNGRSLLLTGNCNNLAFRVNSSNIEFVDSYRHLGHVIKTRFDNFDDNLDKRATFIGKSIIL
jgi:hypothetical protein